MACQSEVAKSEHNPSEVADTDFIPIGQFRRHNPCYTCRPRQLAMIIRTICVAPFESSIHESILTPKVHSATI